MVKRERSFFYSSLRDGDFWVVGGAVSACIQIDSCICALVKREGSFWLSSLIDGDGTVSRSGAVWEAAVAAI